MKCFTQQDLYDMVYRSDAEYNRGERHVWNDNKGVHLNTRNTLTADFMKLFFHILSDMLEVDVIVSHTHTPSLSAIHRTGL